MHGFGDCPKPVVPHGTKEIDLQIQRRQSFPIGQACRVRCANRRVCHIAQNAAVDRPHRVPVSRHICSDFDGRDAIARVDEIETQSSGDGRRVVKSRTEA
jgi:hypothetical protein